MNEQSHQLLDKTALTRVREPLERAWTLPPNAYTDASVFAAEKDKIFTRDWLCVARVDQIAEVGDYVCVDLFGQPIVVARGRDSGLRAISRVCLHRAMPIAEGSGNATRFVCPYHNWTYELDGQLRSAPMMDGIEGFEAKNCQLPQLKLEVWHGFVFVNLDPDAEPLAPRLAGLSKFIENYEFDQMVVVDTIEFDSPWNWKILVENFMEAYHHIGTHKNTFEPTYPARRSNVEDNDGEPWVILRMPEKEHASNDASAFPNLNEEQKSELVAICVYPTLLFAASANGAAWYQLQVSGHDQMHLKIHALTSKTAASQLDDDTKRALMDMLRVVHEEDIEANLGPWHGLQAGLTTQGRLSTFEKSIWQLNQLWLDRLGCA